MPRHAPCLIAGLVVGLFAGACGDDDDEGATASAPPADLAGTKWVLSSYVADNEDVGAAAVAALDFGADGTLSGTTGCNRFGGTFSQDGSNLAIELGPMTLVACSDEATTAQEGAIVDGMSRVASFTTSGQLALLGDDGAVLLIYDPNTADLEGTSWAATGVNNGTGGVESTALTQTISAAFAAGGALSGFAGCNQYNADYETSGSDELTITNVVTTRMACAQDAMTLESRFTTALAKVAGYSISGTTLTLRDADEATQLTFAAAF
jgi:heat shock protein HslJ